MPDFNKENCSKGYCKPSTINIEPDWSLTITRASDGFILSHLEPLDVGYRNQYELVQAGEMDDPADEMIRLLYAVMNFFDPAIKLEIKELREPPNGDFGE